VGQYYKKSLSAERLKRCYNVAPKRTIQYLEAEIFHVKNHINGSQKVLELGCGYGRVLKEIAEKCQTLVGIDLSPDSILMAQNLLSEYENVEVIIMDAEFLGFKDNQFDVVLCIQNGLSAFKIEPIKLVKEVLRVTRKKGLCLFSTYSQKFWNDRLEWFRRQSEEGLLGEIDYDATRPGLIVCKDGFKSSTFHEDDFWRLAKTLKLESDIVEVDNSSLFWEVRK
jgi:ubiquinone/menaquinone biosynthesis C-methylase UbiE